MNKKILLSICCFVFALTGTKAQDMVLPIVNTYTESEPEIIAATSTIATSSALRNTIVAKDLQVWFGREVVAFYPGNFITFHYVSKNLTSMVGRWDGGGQSVQLAYHPGGTVNYSAYENRPEFGPLFVFRYEQETGLCLVNVGEGKGQQLVHDFGIAYDEKNLPTITVFASSMKSRGDIVVVTAKNYFKTFYFTADTNNVREVDASRNVESYYDLEGRSLKEPQHGVNIVVNGQETKKIVVK